MGDNPFDNSNLFGDFFESGNSNGGNDSGSQGGSFGDAFGTGGSNTGSQGSSFGDAFNQSSGGNSNNSFDPWSNPSSGSNGNNSFDPWSNSSSSGSANNSFDIWGNQSAGNTNGPSGNNGNGGLSISRGSSNPQGNDLMRDWAGTARISRGEAVDIGCVNGVAMEKLLVGVGWSPARGSAARIDIDSSVIVYSGTGKFETVDFGHLNHSSGCIHHHGDNLTGSGNGDDENITVYLNRVPSNDDRLVFVLNIYNCVSRHQTFKSVQNLYIKIYDPSSNKTLVQYNVDGNFSNDTALIVGVAYRTAGTWAFKAVGKGSKAKNISMLENECKTVR